MVPELIYSELVDIVKRHGGIIDVGKSYKETPPGGGLRGSIVASFKMEVEKRRLIGGKRKEEVSKEAFNARIFGMTEGETKLLANLDDLVISVGKASEMLADLDFVASSYEAKE